MRSLLGRFVGFFSLPAMAAIVPLAVLPIIARTGSTSNWAAIGIGQAIGVFVAALAMGGWSTLGTPKVIFAHEDEQRLDLYSRGFWGRLVLLCIVSPPAVSLAGALSGPGDFALAGWSVMSTGVAGLALDWYAIGLGSPRLIAMFELLPKTVGSVLSASLALIGLGVVWYPILVFCSTLVGLVCFHVSCWRRPLPPIRRVSVLRDDLRDHLSAWFIEITGNAYSSAPAPIVAVFEKSAVVAQYSSGDKIYRYSLMVLIALGNSLQGWVLSASGRALLRRQRLAVLVHLLVGSGGLLCFVMFGQWATALLFGSKVQSSRPVGIWLGVAFFAISVSTPFVRNILVPARRERLVLSATVLGAVVGLGLMVFGAQVWGAAGVAAALATSELVTAVITGAASAPYLLGYARVHVNPRPDAGSLKTDAGDR